MMLECCGRVSHTQWASLESQGAATLLSDRFCQGPQAKSHGLTCGPGAGAWEWLSRQWGETKAQGNEISWQVKEPCGAKEGKRTAEWDSQPWEVLIQLCPSGAWLPGVNPETCSSPAQKARTWSSQTVGLILPQLPDPTDFCIRGGPGDLKSLRKPRKVRLTLFCRPGQCSRARP